MAGSVPASLDLTQPKPPPLEMPGVCCQAPPACVSHWPWAGEQLGIYSYKMLTVLSVLQSILVAYLFYTQ